MPRTESFERHVDRYDTWFERNRSLHQAELAAVRALMPTAPGMSVEVGVGTGQFAAPLSIGTGIEPSAAMAALARARGIRVCRGVAEGLPFANNSFALVLMVTVICFVDNPLQSLREAYRTLRPGGDLLVGFIDRNSELGQAYQASARTSDFYRDARFVSGRAVARLFRDAGFGEVRFKQTLMPRQAPLSLRDGFGQGAFVVGRGTKLPQETTPVA